MVVWTIKMETTVCKRKIGICLPSPSRCQSVTGVNWPRGTEKTSYRDQARHLQSLFFFYPCKWCKTMFTKYRTAFRADK